MQGWRNQVREMDIERLVLLPVLVFLTFGTVLGTVSFWSSVGTLTSHAVLDGVYQILGVLFYIMMIGLLLFRAKASSGSRSITARVAAYAGTFTPFALALEGNRSVSSPSIAIASISIMTVGMAFSVYALACLGRSFGVEAKARKLVRHGPYRLVRHPLYVGEVFAFLGIVLGRLTAFSFVVLVVLIILQTYRALQEERVLAEAFPEYTSYMVQTRRFIPGLV